MSMYNLKGYSNNYLKTWRNLWLFYRKEPALDDNSIIGDFVDGDTTDLFELIRKINKPST